MNKKKLKNKDKNKIKLLYFKLFREKEKKLSDFMQKFPGKV